MNADHRDMGARMFVDRTPEAAARQLAIVLAWIVECELATLERLRTLKSASKSEINRHESIVKDAIYHCRDLRISPSGLDGRSCPRLAELLREQP